LAERRDEFVDNEFEAPHGSLETLIANIQCEILDVDRFGRTDSFYDFSGTSLDAIRICARIERDSGYRALPVWLLETDILADFAKRLEAEGHPADG
jgi:hypothetical protein